MAAANPEAHALVVARRPGHTRFTRFALANHRIDLGHFEPSTLLRLPNSVKMTQALRVLKI